jgi:hypothetical protein
LRTGCCGPTGIRDGRSGNFSKGTFLQALVTYLTNAKVCFFTLYCVSGNPEFYEENEKYEGLGHNSDFVKTSKFCSYNIHFNMKILSKSSYAVMCISLYFVCTSYLLYV